jgi:hypothetical protein
MKRIFLWCALILAVGVTILWPMIPVASAEGRLASIPQSGPDFETRPIELSPEDKAFLGEARAVKYLIIMRDRSQLMLTVVDGTKNRHAVHDPSYCFSGAGWRIQAKDSVKLSSGEANLVSLVRENSKTEALWFFDDGKHQFTSPIEYWIATSSRRATLGRSGAEPVLVTLRGLTGEPVDWNRVRQILLPSLGFR